MNSSNKGKKITLTQTQEKVNYKGKKIAALLSAGVLVVGAFVAGGKLQQQTAKDNDVQRISKEYAENLLDRTDPLTIVEHIFANEYNKFYGKDLPASNIKIREKNGEECGFKLSELEENGLKYKVICNTEGKGQGTIIEYIICDKDENPVETYYSSKDSEGKPIFTVDMDTLGKMLNGNKEPNEFETEIIPELHQKIMECALECGDAEFSKEFKKKLVKYLTEQAKEAIKSDVEIEYGDVLALQPRSEQWLKITEDDIKLIEDYYASNFGVTSTIIAGFKREYLIHLDDPEDWRRFINAVEEWVNSDDPEAKQVKEYLQKEYVSAPIEEILQIFDSGR